MIEINLLPPQNVLSQREKALRRYLLTALAAGLIGVFLCGFGIFLGRSFFVIRAEVLSQQRADLETQIANEIETLQLLHTIHAKLEGIRAIKKSQVNFTVILKRFLEIEELGARIGAISLGPGRAVRFSVRTVNVDALKKVLNNLSVSSESHYFSKTEISNLQEEIDGTFSFVVNAVYHE